MKLSHVCQVKVNAGEGQTYVFISIILHNNTGPFYKGQKKRGKTDVIKGHPATGFHIWKMFIYKPRLKTHVACMAAAA